jgi:hypothetical protein
MVYNYTNDLVEFGAQNHVNGDWPNMGKVGQM